MTPEQILTHIAKRVHPALHHLLGPEAALADLRLNPVDHWSICCDIEEDLSRELDWSQVERWQTVPDIVASVEAARKAAA